MESGVVSEGVMTIDDVLRDFAVIGYPLPEAAMRWARDNWAEAGPRFIELLERYDAGAEATEEMMNTLFFVIHLLGERRETKAFPALCRLLKDADACDAILGDAITASLPDILISTYDGNAAALKEVIEATTADDFTRVGALQAMAYLTRAGAFTDDDMRAYLEHLLAEMRPQAASFLWDTWAASAANLGYADFAGKVEQLIRRKLIPSRCMNMAEFREQLRLALADPEGLAGFKQDHIGPFTDAIETLASWDSFIAPTAQGRIEGSVEGEEASTWPDSGEPYLNPLRKIGRNDPCPCGSGKKYKKCCLP